ncbi:CU044_5270 family protein [Streptomyces sp. NPDC048352]|uniref:CU044_5270 family protein n=1 Tax=Streptomyces sp. NPDC048352 TaxID=3154718 RepID=UPI00342B3D39
MNAADDARVEPSAREEVLRRLPGLSDAELPFRKQHLIKGHLMREAAEGRPAAGRAGRPLFLSLAAAAAACAVVGAFVLSDSGPAEHPRAARPEPAAVRFLDRVAWAAAQAPAPSVRDGQFLYTKTVGHSTALSEVAGGGMEASRIDQSAEVWVSVDGTAATTTRTARGTGTHPPDGKPTLNGPTYRFLETLPTDPDRLRKVIYADARLNHGPGSGSTTGPDQEAFVMIGDILKRGGTPPGLSAALYRVAARIPGVVLVPGATDAAGRTGVAVARVHDGERTEWIFDEGSLGFMGERTVLLKDGTWGRAGSEVTSVAVVGRGVTDRPEQLP